MTEGVPLCRRVLYYALGGGHGHALRGLALVSRLPGSTLVLPARLAAWAAELCVPHVAAPENDLHGFAATLDPPEMMIVDVFPRGPTGELGPLLERAPLCWLVARHVQPELYLHPPVRAVLESRYERLVWTEPPHPALSELTVPALRIPPVLLAPQSLPRAAARDQLGVDAAVPLVLALGSGPAELQYRLLRLLAKTCERLGAVLRFVSHELPEVRPLVRALFPAARWLAAADVVVAAGGYHAFHETRAAGVPAVFLPQQRRHDVQAERVAGGRTASSPEELEAELRRALGERRGGARRIPAEALVGDAPRLDAAEGALLLARLVERRVQAGVLGEEEIAAQA
jgi:hypothetical protein